jgi:hypothetical protein
MDDLVANYTERVTRVIVDCASQHPNEIFSALAFFEDVGNGIFAVGLDTLDNSLLHAKRQELRVRQSRAACARRDGEVAFCERRASEWGFQLIHDFNNSFSEFKYAGIVSDYVAEWIDDPQVTSGYLLYLVWRIVDALVASDVLADLKLASPFRFCFMNLDKEDALVLRMLNWPPHVGPRV